VIEYLAAYQPPRIDRPHDPRDSGLILAAVVAHLTAIVNGGRRGGGGTVPA
jgi:hypothetical protein